MVTQAQKDQFISTYTPYAKQAGANLGVSGNVILAQWSFETGWGTNRGATQLNNLGGVNVPGGHGEDYQSYSTPQDFTSSYVSMIQRKYPQSTNVGDDASAYVAGLKQGGYFTGDLNAYQSNVSSNASTIANNSNYQTTSASTGSLATPPVKPKPPSSPSSTTGDPTLNPDSVEGGRENAGASSTASNFKPAPAPSAQQLKDMLTKWLKPNPLNEYWQPTYHFKLFMAGDAELLSRAGAGSITELLKQVNGKDVPQVIIAESGVTGAYNIKDVEILSVDSMNAQTREQKGTEVTMTILEPMGISFIDAMAGAGTLLKVWDYTKMVYYLELSFTGYTEDGRFAGRPLAFDGYKNGGRWLWALKFTTIDTKVNEGGGVYTLHFVTTETELVISEDKHLKPKQTVAPEGNTLGELFENYTKKLNDAWKAEYGKGTSGQPLIKFTIKTHPIPFVADQYAGKDPADFKLKPQKPDKNPIRALAMEEKNGKYVVTVPAGMSINDFLSAAIMSTEEGQALYKDEPVIGQPDMSPTQTNAQRFRVSKLFSIEPDVKPVSYDQTSGNYVKEITLHVTPTYWQGAILSRPQVDDAKKAEVQRQMVQNLGTNGFVRKKYEYIFTGMNTEVLDFDITFNMAFQAELPKAAGYRMNALNNADPARKRDEDPLTIPSEKLKFLDFKGDGSTVPQQADAIKMPTTTSFNKSGFFADMTTLGSTPTPTKKAVIDVSSSAGSEKIYMEDILSRLNQGQTNFLPISFSHGYLVEHFETGLGVNGQYHPDRPLAATVLVQKMTANFFQNIDMTIRGDPFWLGQSNIERQIALRQGKVHEPEELPNFVTGPSNILVYFRFPLQLGDDFRPVLKDSAAFNGIYQVTKIKHTFSDGAFKQVLTAVRSPLMDLTKALSTDANAITNAASSAAVSENNNPTSNTSAGNNTPGTDGSAIAPSGSLPNSQTQQDRAKESFNFWTSKGYSPAAASGNVAQEEAETGFDWTKTGDSGAAKGAFQWHSDRQAAILAGTGIDISDPNTTHQQQLEAAYWEQTQGPEVKAGNKIRAAINGGEAGDLGSRYYERPKEKDAEAQKRAGRGQFWQNQFDPALNDPTHTHKA